MRQSFLCSFRRRRGVVAVQATFCLTALCGVLALVLDGGLLMTEKRHAQAVSDAAALSAAITLYQNRAQISSTTPDPSNAAQASALAVASANGYTNDGSTSTVTVNIPPQSGNFAGQLDYAEVLVQYNQPRYFSAIFGSGTIPVTARSVARWKITNLDISILALNGYPGFGTPVSGALTLKGNGAITVPGDVVVDSTSSAAAASAAGNATLVSAHVDVSGTISTSGNATFNAPSLGSQAYVNENVMPQTSDPLAALPEPNPNTLTTQSNSPYRVTSGDVVTLNPGVYQGGIRISGGASVTLNPGIYYLAGGGLKISGSGQLYGSGVLLYNGAPVGSTDPSQVGNISIPSQSLVQLTPMSSGTWQGITIFQDRLSTSSLGLAGGSGTKINGMVYAPMAPASVAGGSNIVPGQSFITNTLTLTGNGNLTIPQPSIPVPNPSITLVE